MSLSFSGRSGWGTEARLRTSAPVHPSGSPVCTHPTEPSHRRTRSTRATFAPPPEPVGRTRGSKAPDLPPTQGATMLFSFVQNAGQKVITNTRKRPRRSPGRSRRHQKQHRQLRHRYLRADRRLRPVQLHRHRLRRGTGPGHGREDPPVLRKHQRRLRSQRQPDRGRPRRGVPVLRRRLR
jgi:hypothetical protein